MILRKIAEIILRSNLRGGTRFTLLLARNFASLQSIPIKLPNGDSLIVDLRLLSTHNLMIGKVPEIAEQQVMRNLVKEGMFAIDIGAHVGVHTILLSKLVERGRVWAFEPQPDCLPSLRQTVATLSNVVLFTLALSDKKGETEFYIAEHRPMSGLSNWTASSKKIKCQTATLDELVEKENHPPDFIKCDIEGAELLCFRGARKTLDRKQAPIMLFEANEAAHGLGFEINDAFDFLKNLENAKYSFFEILPEGDLIEIKLLRHMRSNILAIPQSKLEILGEGGAFR
jgi:FkbM family methyltransferase